MIFSKIKVSNKLKTYFRLKFKSEPNLSDSRSQILLEFNAFQSYHVPVAYFSNFLKKKYQSKLVGYFNYKALITPFEENIINKIKWKIGNFLNIKSFSIFRSFDVNRIIKPELTFVETKLSNKIFNRLKKKILNKDDVLKLSLDNIKIGDLLYDTYLKSSKNPTLFLDNKFYSLLSDFCKLYIFWKNYFKNNNIKAIIGVHSSYSYGLPLRIALKKKIPTYCVTFRKINKLSNKMQFLSGEFVNFKKKFKKIDKKIKKDGLSIAKKKIKMRFDGVAGIKSHIISSEVSSFSKKFLKRRIFKTEKPIIVIFPHDFFDAVHAYGKNLFNDFYEWLEFLGKISKNTDYCWYIKNRPNYPGKFKIYQPKTDHIINKFVEKYPNIIRLPNNYSHNQIINEGITCALTAYGTVALEYAFFNIPVINASVNNPHINYNFCLHPKSIREYEDLILNVKNVKVKVNKSDIYEFFFMRHIYSTKSWLINDLNKYMKFVGGWSNMNSYKFYEFWLNNTSQKKENKINKVFEKFILSNDDVLNLSHTSNNN